MRNGETKKVDTSREKTSVSLRVAKMGEEDLTPTDEIPVPLVATAPETPPSGRDEKPVPAEEPAAPSGGDAEKKPDTEPKG